MILLQNNTYPPLPASAPGPDWLRGALPSTPSWAGWTRWRATGWTSTPTTGRLVTAMVAAVGRAGRFVHLEFCVADHRRPRRTPGRGAVWRPGAARRIGCGWCPTTGRLARVAGTTPPCWPASEGSGVEHPRPRPRRRCGARRPDLAITHLLVVDGPVDVRWIPNLFPGYTRPSAGRCWRTLPPSRGRWPTRCPRRLRRGLAPGRPPGTIAPGAAARCLPPTGRVSSARCWPAVPGSAERQPVPDVHDADLRGTHPTGADRLLPRAGGVAARGDHRGGPPRRRRGAVRRRGVRRFVPPPGPAVLLRRGCRRPGVRIFRRPAADRAARHNTSRSTTRWRWWARRWPPLFPRLGVGAAPRRGGPCRPDPGGRGRLPGRPRPR